MDIVFFLSPWLNREDGGSLRCFLDAKPDDLTGVGGAQVGRCGGPDQVWSNMILMMVEIRLTTWDV